MINNKNEFYQAASDWTYDIYQSHTVWLRRAFVTLIIVTLLLTASILSNLFLIPLKEKVPYLYAFDHATGEITKIGSLEATSFKDNWELSKYLLIHYVINRESYDADNIDLPYQFVWAQSADNVKQQYESEVRSSNLQAPFRLYGKDKYITVRVIAVNKLNDNTVDVKLEKTLHDRIANTEQVIQKEAIIKWQFDKAQTSQKMLERDPVGFKITYYQITQVNLN